MANAFLIALPVELLHYIFDHLDAQTILNSIRGVCKTLYAIVNTYDRFQLDFSSMKTSENKFISHFIPSENIISLILHNNNRHPIQFERRFTRFEICSFTRVRSLIIRETDTDYYISTLQNFIGCPLVSLSIHIPEQACSITIIRIFSLITLFNLQKIYLHNFDFKLEHIPFLSKCLLQHLTIGTCSYKVYHEILRHFHHLRSLVMNDWTINNTNQSIIKGRFRFLTVVYIYNLVFQYSHAIDLSIHW